ncbi:hypothetical protein [Pseudomonas aeruginosa]|uniref:hypothetical protein n=1 Tax=Pseudomonas aeruginosa TaxID=287 RepID=UPI000E681672|nr:hypothetical protein [Pseudomonas aeruginosa]QLF40593.1 hypothetical protein GNT62_14820 [Pseudomonas aeruginosa]RIZ02307.1 hypothetical protein AXW97_10905 [Pseudomonas aeruginosa]
MTPAIERLQSALDQEMHNALTTQRQEDYRQLFLTELEQQSLTDSEWLVLLYQLFSVLSGGTLPKSRTPSSTCLAEPALIGS